MIRRILVAFVLIAIAATPARGQEVLSIDSLFLGTASCHVRAGSGSPEGVVTDSVCAAYVDTATGNIYTKQSGAGNTGWTIVPRLALANAWTAAQAFNGGATATTLAASTSVTTPIVTAASNLTVSPTGDVVLNPTGLDVLPGTGYTVNLGALTNKYLALHAAELWVETLVAQNTLATIGGRILVAPTTTLTADLASGATSMTVKHNSLANGDRVYLEANGAVEFIAVASAPSGSGPYTYTITRNLDGSGANNWSAGDAVLNTGTTGSGFIDLYSIGGVLAGSGPSIVGNVRTGTAYNAIAPRWAIGNLNGLYGYGATTFGFAAGDATATNITADATNGFRIRSGTTDKFTADTSGNLTLTGDLAMSTSGVIRAGATAFGTGTGYWLDYNAGTPRFRIGSAAGRKIEWDGSDLTMISSALTVSPTQFLLNIDAQQLASKKFYPGPTSGVGYGSTWYLGAGTNGIFTNGGVYERSRVTMLGDWTPVTYAGGNFTANGSMTWTVDAGDQADYKYTLVGTTMTVSFAINTSTVGGTVNSGLQIAIPGGFSASGSTDATFNYFDGCAPQAATGLLRASGTVLTLFKSLLAPNWTTCTNTVYVSGSITFQIS